jgi:6-phosphofructokinase 2
MPDILTVTMNPALDVSTFADQVVPDHKVRCKAAQQHPGGGGINVARVLHRLGADVQALYPAGGASGQALDQLLDAEQVPHHALPIAQDTRQSFSVHESGSGHDFRFVLPGPTLSQAEWNACLNWVSAMPVAPHYVVASGSLPPGVPDDFYAQLAQLAQARGSKLVLDTSGPALRAALAQGVYLFKPSLRELQELTGLPLGTADQQLDAARLIIQQSQAQIVAVSLGADGALLVTADQAWRARSLPVTVASTIGAGDSFVGGLVWALSQGADLDKAFAQAMAAAAAALLSAGTSLCQADDVARLLQKVEIEPVAP